MDRLVIGVLALVIFYPGKASSAPQDLLAFSIEELMQVTITSSSYFEETVSESINSVSYSDESRWNELAVRNVGELMNQMPSTVAVPYLGSTQGVAIRGYLSGINFNGVAVHLDGVPMNKLRPGSGTLELDGFDLSTLSSVEVVRGSGSALHGVDAFHGVVSMGLLDFDVQDEAVLGAGTENEAQASIAASGQFGASDLMVAGALRRIGDQSLEYAYTDETGNARSSERSNELENANVLLKYRTRLSSDTLVYATGYAFTLNANELPGLGRILNNTSEQAEEDWTYLDSQTALLKVGVDHSIDSRNDWQFFGYVWRNQDKFTADYRSTSIGVKLEEYREELHWGAKALNRLLWNQGQLAYGYEFRSELLDDFKAKTSFPLGGVEESQRPESGFKRDTHSLFVDGRADVPGIDAELVAGLRWDHHKDFDDQFSPRIGFLMPLGSGLSGRIQASRAYRAPNLFEIYGAPNVKPNFGLNPEILDTIELGLSYQAGDAYGAVTLFSNRWTDAIQLVEIEPEAGFIATYMNEGQNESQGIEVEYWVQWDKLRTEWAVSYIESKNTDTGQDYNAFPHWIANLGVGYGFSESLDLFFNSRYFDRQVTSAEFLGGTTIESASPFLQVDAVLQWAVESNVTLLFAVRNVFDRSNSYPSTTNHEGGLPGNARNASVKLSYQY